MYVYATFFIAAVVIYFYVIQQISNWLKSRKENFYNVIPTEWIDPEYQNINNKPENYFESKKSSISSSHTSLQGWETIGDTRGPDMNCNYVTYSSLINWVLKHDPNILYDYVYIDDPSIEIMNPIHAPRVLKMLLRNLPGNHNIKKLVENCFKIPVGV
jgi:hypothetical protein